MRVWWRDVCHVYDGACAVLLYARRRQHDTLARNLVASMFVRTLGVPYGEEPLPARAVPVRAARTRLVSARGSAMAMGLLYAVGGPPATLLCGGGSMV